MADEASAPAAEPAAFCTNDFPAKPPPPAAAPEPAPAAAPEPCTNEFADTGPEGAGQPADNTVTLLSTYRALKKRPAADAWAWLNRLTVAELATIKSALESEWGSPCSLGGQGGPGGPADLPGAH
jgi:hypothetical protein